MPIVTGYIGPMHARHLRWGGGPRVRVQGPSDWRVQRLSAADLIAFVDAAVAGELFFVQEIVPFDDLNIAAVFPAAAFLREVTEEARREIGCVYERREMAAGTARNGQPSFQSVRFIHREDWKIASELIAARLLAKERVS